MLFTELGASHLDDLASLLDDWGCLCESLKQYEKALELFKVCNSDYFLVMMKKGILLERERTQVFIYLIQYVLLCIR